MPFRRFLLAALVVFHAAGLAKAGDEGDWTAVTVARDGSWGAATARSLSHAIATAVGDCKSKVVGANDCGAEIKTTRGGWILALGCGGYRVLVAAETLEEAEAAAFERRLELKYIHSVGLPSCARLLLVDPGGVAATGNKPLDTSG